VVKAKDGKGKRNPLGSYFSIRLGYPGDKETSPFTKFKEFEHVSVQNKRMLKKKGLESL
jgi:hypothetical protein